MRITNQCEKRSKANKNNINANPAEKRRRRTNCDAINVKKQRNTNLTSMRITAKKEDMRITNQCETEVES